MSEPIVLYCKTYAPDLPRLLRLLENVERHNISGLPFYVSAPRADLPLFREAMDGRALCLEDEEYCRLDPACQDGWRNQQVVKASFGRLGACENYLCLDADSFFIRDFTAADFLYQGGIPYTVCHDQDDLYEWSVLNRESLGFDPKALLAGLAERVRELLSAEPHSLYDFGPSPVVFNCLNWAELDRRCLRPYNLGLESLIYRAPSEFLWYGEWLLKNRTFPLVPRGPLFKSFHY